MNGLACLAGLTGGQWIARLARLLMGEGGKGVGYFSCLKRRVKLGVFSCSRAAWAMTW